jgi:hypothetical protein
LAMFFLAIPVFGHVFFFWPSLFLGHFFFWPCFILAISVFDRAFFLPLLLLVMFSFGYPSFWLRFFRPPFCLSPFYSLSPFSRRPLSIVSALFFDDYFFFYFFFNIFSQFLFIKEKI